MKVNIYKLLLPFIGLVLTIIVAMHFDKKQAKRATAATEKANQEVLKNFATIEININQKIVKHYENIDSLVYVRDSILHEQRTNTIRELQRAVDSLFNQSR